MEPTQTPVLRIPLRCACCGLPFATLVQAPTGWYVEIASRHNGERHTNIIPLLGVAMSDNSYAEQAIRRT